MEIQIYVSSKKQPKKTSSIQSNSKPVKIDLIRCHPEKFYHDLEGVLREFLCPEDQLAISRLAMALEISEEKNCQITIKDYQNAINIMESYSKYQTIESPLIVIGNKIFKGLPSILELLEAILIPNSASNAFMARDENEEEYFN